MARILVVDDRPENRDLLSYLLGYFGHVVSTACDGAAAVRAAMAEPPDLILMDLAMPGMDGYTAARLIRSEPVLRHVPLVAVSAAGSATLELVRQAGFDDFYPMPIEPRDFVARIEPFLSREEPTGSRP
jgi:two-component system cell cycle response regulator DivK